MGNQSGNSLIEAFIWSANDIHYNCLTFLCGIWYNRTNVLIYKREPNEHAEPIKRRYTESH